MSNIVLGSIDISVDFERVKDFKKDDQDLIRTAKQKEKQLEKQGKEIFERDKNIVVSEDGYYITVYESDIKRLDE